MIRVEAGLSMVRFCELAGIRRAPGTGAGRER